MIKISNISFAYNSTLESKVLELIKNNNLKFLQDIFCVQEKKYFTMTYNFYDENFENKFVIEISEITGDDEIFSLHEKFDSAVFLEREVFELFGVKFKNIILNNSRANRMFVFSEGVVSPMLRKGF